MLTVIVHIVPYARDLGLSPTIAAGVLSTIGGVSILGRIVMGAANDRIGGRHSLIICLIVLFCGFIVLQLAAEAWMLFLFAVIYGFAHGGFFTVVSPMVAELFGTGSHGLLFGIILFSGTLGGAVGPLMAGRTFDLTGSYQVVFLVLSVLTLIGFVLNKQEMKSLLDYSQERTDRTGIYNRGSSLQILILFLFRTVSIH